MTSFDRRRLFGLAYRMLGSIADAEDVVQDAYLRWQATAAEIELPQAYQARIVTRLCLDHLKSARVRRERYVGAWLPEPLVEAAGETGAEAEIAGDVSVALMLALERLSPLERAAFLLHDVFDMEFTAVGEVLGRTDVACRRLAARARTHVREARPRFPVAAAMEAKLTRAFRAASAGGDVAALGALLAQDCVLVSDGGGKRPAAINPIVGRDRIARFFEGLHHKFGYRDTGPVDIVRINGLPGYLTVEVKGVLQTTALQVADGRVQAIYVVRNPEKLGHLTKCAQALASGLTSRTSHSPAATEQAVPCTARAAAPSRNSPAKARQTRDSRG